MHPRTAAPVPPEEEKVVGYVTSRYKGIAFALQKRAEQLDNTIYAGKQYIHTLRHASQVSIDAHKKAQELLRLPPQLFSGPIPSLSDYSTVIDTWSTKGIQAEDDLLCEDGLKSLLNGLALHHEKTAEAVEKLNDPLTLLRGIVEDLNENKAQINSLLSKDRLGKSHHHQEETLCTAASELNNTIVSLSKACSTSSSPATAYHDPHTICRDGKFRMKEYLTMERDYEARCLQEQAALQAFENGVFKALQRVPVEQEKIMSPLMDKCNEILAEVETKTTGFHALTDWTAFENKHANEFAREDELRPFVLTQENHPDDAQFLEYQVLELAPHKLHIYYKLRKQDSSSKPKADKPLGIKLKLAVTQTRRDYAPRGTWTISVGGNLIEYDNNERAMLSMFNLRKCKLSTLSQKDPESNKQSSTYCYFTLYGQKVHEPSDKKKHRMKKEYKFRAPLGVAQVVHQELSKFCSLAEEKGFEKMGEKKAETEDKVQETLLEDTVAGSDEIAGSDEVAWSDAAVAGSDVVAETGSGDTFVV